MASSEKSFKKDKNQNIQVFVRLRPLNQRERAIRSLGCVEVVNGREVVVRPSQQNLHLKRFTFDRAFGPNVEQVEVYKEVVSPLIAEVLAGYNCTVFAYGQTGTGKTHTMVGENSGEGTTWQNDPLAGIIPRALSQLFDELRISNAEYTVRVSYLELYNEELFDLLSSSDDNSKLRIYEDVTRKGSTIVNGLEEITVYNKNEVYEIMSQGQERKRVASTLMNAQSSRSHTVFTIVVHMKENNCTKGEELVKIGKLNLVDLAGSENISKAGSDNPAKRERARECVNINQSLLTLGRVITALVEKHPHIPYRESKLTRILQESLGGRTKTSIIATISPGHKDVEETMSTLEYANRAKNIQNKPEVNQKLTKQAILKEFAEEVDKLKRELTAAREKHGVYLPSETYVEMTLKHDEQRREIQELLLKKRAMEEERVRMESVFQELSVKADRTEEALARTRDQLDTTSTKLTETVQQCAEQQHLVDKHLQTEGQLSEQAQQLIATADVATQHVACLHDTVDRRRTVESVNQEVVSAYREECTAQRQKILSGVHDCTGCFVAARDQLQANIDDHARDTSMTQELNIQDMKLLVAKMGMFMNEIKTLTTEAESQFSSVASDCRSQLEASAATRRETLHTVLQNLVLTVATCVQRADDTEVNATVARCTEQWLKQATARVSCLQQTQSSSDSQSRALESRRQDATRRRHNDRLAQLHARELHIQTCMAELEKDKRAMEQRMTQQLSTIETERDETERRLQDWMEQERRSLEERMARHVEIERNALNTRLETYIANLEINKQMLEESTANLIQLQEMQREVNREEKEMEDAYLEQCKKENEEYLKSADEFAKEFGEGTSAINAELEAFGSSVGQVVAHTTDQLLAELRHAHDTVKSAAQEVSSRDAEAVRLYSQNAHAAVISVVADTSRVLTAVVDKTQESTSSTTETVNSVAERSSCLAGTSLSAQEHQSAALRRASTAVCELEHGLREELARQADAERRYLMQEYRVYSPSGNTPARREFRYPRRLVATSPHDRILQRFRALQQRETHSPDSDCIVLESDEGRHTSDSDENDVSESDGVSEDSAVAMQ